MSVVDPKATSDQWARLLDLLNVIFANCPKMDALGNNPCGAHYLDLC